MSFLLFLTCERCAMAIFMETLLLDTTTKQPARVRATTVNYSVLNSIYITYSAAATALQQLRARPTRKEQSRLTHCCPTARSCTTKRVNLRYETWPTRIIISVNSVDKKLHIINNWVNANKRHKTDCFYAQATLAPDGLTPPSKIDALRKYDITGWYLRQRDLTNRFNGSSFFKFITKCPWTMYSRHKYFIGRATLPSRGHTSLVINLPGPVMEISGSSVIQWPSSF